MKKRNATNLTTRNNNARKREIARLRRRLIREVRWLRARVTRLEKGRKRR